MTSPYEHVPDVPPDSEPDPHWLEMRDAERTKLPDYYLPPAGSPVEVMVDHLKVLASKEPERVAEVVKQWVQKHGRTE